MAFLLCDNDFLFHVRTDCRILSIDDEKQILQGRPNRKGNGDIVLTKFVCLFKGSVVESRTDVVCGCRSLFHFKKLFGIVLCVPAVLVRVDIVVTEDLGDLCIPGLVNDCVIVSLSVFLLNCFQKTEHIKCLVQKVLVNLFKFSV